MNLLRLNVWRKLILVSLAMSIFALFAFDWGYHFHVGHVVRLAVGAAALWLVVDRV
jgi:hypothetical protein